MTIPTGLAKAYFLTTRSEQATQVEIAMPDDVISTPGAHLWKPETPVSPRSLASLPNQGQTYHIVLSIRSSLAKEPACIGLDGLIFHTQGLGCGVHELPRTADCQARADCEDHVDLFHSLREVSPYCRAGL